MSQNNVNLFKIKDGKLDTWLAWCEQLNTVRRNEAEATLTHEGVICEFFITFEVEGQHYTLGAEISDLNQSKSAPEENEINNIHKATKQECLEYIGPSSFSYLLGL